MIINRTPLYGSIIEQNPLAGVKSPFVAIPGRFSSNPAFVGIDDSTLSKHLLLIGGTGCGKSNVLYHIISQIKRKMSKKDVMIIFDTKGDYLNLFRDESDFIIGNSKIHASQSSKWNIFKEIVADGWDYQTIEMNTQEISWAIFRSTIDRSKDPFFPNAARDLFGAIILSMLMSGIEDKNYRNEYLYNSELKKTLDESDIYDIKALVEQNPALKSVISYIGDGSSDQALGVYAELMGTFRQLFTGVFADTGIFSIRNFVKHKEGRTLFVEYDISIGNVLAPIYSLLFDLAIKEALSRSNEDGNVYLVCDEFKLLPYLQHIEDGVNFGRSLGLKIMAGLQSINQITEVYGEYRGSNIVAGFSSIFAFKANDSSTRSFVTNLHGKNLILEQYKTITSKIQEEKRIANVVEDWDMNGLDIGEAIISLPFGNPYKFKFDLYK